MEEVADMKDMFQKMDIRSNGKITLEELKHGLHKMGHQIPDADVQILMEAVSVTSSLSHSCVSKALSYYSSQKTKKKVDSSRRRDQMLVLAVSVI